MGKPADTALKASDVVEKSETLNDHCCASACDDQLDQIDHHRDIVDSDHGDGDHVDGDHVDGDHGNGDGDGEHVWQLTKFLLTVAAALLSTDAQDPILPVSALTQAGRNLVNKAINTITLACGHGYDLK